MKIRSYIQCIVYIIHMFFILLRFPPIESFALISLFIFPIIFLKINKIFKLERGFDFFVFQIFSYIGFASMIEEELFFLKNIYFILLMTIYVIGNKNKTLIYIGKSLVIYSSIYWGMSMMIEGTPIFDKKVRTIVALLTSGFFFILSYRKIENSLITHKKNKLFYFNIINSWIQISILRIGELKDKYIHLENKSFFYLLNSRINKFIDKGDYGFFDTDMIHQLLIIFILFIYLFFKIKDKKWKNYI